jgi:hypothetical protein
VISFATRSLTGWLLSWLNRRRVERVRWFFAPGRILLLLRRDTWSGEFVGREAIREWLDRFVECRVEIFVLDVMTARPPWNMWTIPRPETSCLCLLNSPDK